MTDKTNAPQPAAGDELARLAAKGSAGILSEYWAFLRTRKKLWLTPVLVLLFLVGLLVVVGSTPVGMAIYTMF